MSYSLEACLGNSHYLLELEKVFLLWFISFKSLFYPRNVGIICFSTVSRVFLGLLIFPFSIGFFFSLIDSPDSNLGLYDFIYV